MGNDKKIELLAGDEIYVNGKWFWDVIKADQEYVTVKMYYNKEYPGINTPNSSSIKIPKEAFSIFSENNGIKYCMIGETTLKKLTGGLFRLLKVQQDISELMESAGHTGIITSLDEFRRINESSEKIIVANIRYADDEKELKPLTRNGILYVKRHGDTKTAFYRLNYNDVTEFGYATLGEEIPYNFFEDKNIQFIDSEYYKKYKIN